MSTKLYVGNLPYRFTSDDLSTLFSQSGNVASSRVVTDRETGRSRGFGFVEMTTPDEAKSAIEKFNGSDLEGRALVVNEARPMPPRDGGGGGGRDRGDRGDRGGGRDRRY
ncbi:MAG: RNA-binding protein [Spirochaetia bacterium]|nr:RNA-binding protein [Spirochaetia bacterium]